MEVLEIAVACQAIALVFGVWGLFWLLVRKDDMTEAFDKLKADEALLIQQKNDAKAAAVAALAAKDAAEAKAADLQTQLDAAKAAQGTPDADVSALDADVVAALDPVAAPPVDATPAAA